MMEQKYNQEEIFEKIDFTQNSIPKGIYEYCQFSNCDFSNSDLSDVKFMDCEFYCCNPSMTKLIGTVLRDIVFNESKLLGMQFENCNDLLLSVKFTNCNLSHSSFYKVNLKMTIFENTKLHEVDFTECNLSSSIFDNCDLSRAIFDNTNIEKTDFRTSCNYSINPEINRIKRAKFSLPEVVGLLGKYDINIT